MKQKPTLPRNDDEYDALLKRIVEGAEYLENPLIKPEVKAAGMKLYDEMCELARTYRTQPEERRRRQRGRNIPNSETA